MIKSISTDHGPDIDTFVLINSGAQLEMRYFRSEVIDHSIIMLGINRVSRDSTLGKQTILSKPIQFWEAL